MAKLKLIETIQTKLSTLTKSDGQLIVVRDNASLYIDLDGNRVYISDWIDVETDTDRLTMLSPLSNKYYYVIETNKIWRYVSGSWVLVSSINDLNEHIEDTDIHITTIERTNWDAAKTHADSVHTIAQGGTNGTTAKQAQYNLLNNIPERTAELTDSDYSTVLLATPNETNGFLAKMKITLLWDYIRKKIRTNAKAVEYDVTSGMTESIASVSDDTQVAFVYTSPSETQGRFYWRKAPYLWDYIKGKANALYLKRASTTMVGLGFTADSTVTVEEFLLALRTKMSNNDAQVDFAWNAANSAKVSDGTNSVTINGGVIYTSGHNNVLTGTWSNYHALYFHQTSGTFYKFTITVSGEANVYTTSMKIYKSLDALTAYDLPTIPIDKGGTGATAAKEARYNLSNDMPQAEGIIADTDYFAGVYQTQSKDNGGVYKKKMSLIWDYIKSKISSVLGLTATNYNGTSAKATADASGNNIEETYAKDSVNVMTKEIGEWKKCNDIGSETTTCSVIGINYGNGKYVASLQISSQYGGGVNGYISDDGINWTYNGNCYTSAGRGTVYINGYWFKSNNNKVYYSHDLANWTETTAPYYKFFAYGNGVYVSKNCSSGNIYYSNNGTEWNDTGFGSSHGTINMCEYGNDLFVAVGATGSTYYSKNGVSWVKNNAIGSNELVNILYGNGIFVTYDNYGYIYSSVDGVSWKTNRTGTTTTTGTKISYANGLFYCYIGGEYFESYDCEKLNSIDLPDIPIYVNDMYLCSDGKYLNYAYTMKIKKDIKIEDAISMLHNEVSNVSHFSHNSLTKIPSTTVYIPTTGWVSDTEYNGYGYLYEQSISDYYDEYPEFFLKPATGIVPTSAEQTAFNNIAAMKLDSANKKLKFYAATKPTTNLLVVVKGVV